MNCPKCAVELETVDLPVPDRSEPGHDRMKSLEIDTCPECAGVWFDKDELDEFYDAHVTLKAPALGHADPKALDDKTGVCPRCAVALARGPARYNPKVTVDDCAKCGGTWVDGAELDAAGGGGLDFGDRMKALFAGAK